MEHIKNFTQLHNLILDSGLNETELGILLTESTDPKIKFGIACHLDDHRQAIEILTAAEEIGIFIPMLPLKNRENYMDLILQRALEISPISSSNDGKKFLSIHPDIKIEDIEPSPSYTVAQKVAIALYVSPNKILDNNWNKEIVSLYTINEMTNYYSHYDYLAAVLPISPAFFIKNVLREDDNVIKNYLFALSTKDIAVEDYFDAIASLENNNIHGKILIKDDSFSFEFDNGIQKALFTGFDIKLEIPESDALFTERELGATEVDGELLFRDNKIVADLRSEELTTLESFRAQVYTFLATSVATVGKVVSSPKTKMALLALSAFGVMGEAWGADADTESGISSIVNKLEKAHTLKGFEGGKQFQALDAQLEQVGVDLDDLKFPGGMNSRTINWSGEEGDYTLKIGDASVEFEYVEDGSSYQAVVRNASSSTGIISSEDLHKWATGITNKLNKALKEAE